LQSNDLRTQSPDLLKYVVTLWSRWKCASGRLYLSPDFFQLDQFPV
jgi:hypothetical protein